MMTGVRLSTPQIHPALISALSPGGKCPGGYLGPVNRATEILLNVQQSFDSLCAPFSYPGKRQGRSRDSRLLNCPCRFGSAVSAFAGTKQRFTIVTTRFLSPAGKSDQSKHRRRGTFWRDDVRILSVILEAPKTWEIHLLTV